jgi:cytochrome c peroxidase
MVKGYGILVYMLFTAMLLMGGFNACERDPIIPENFYVLDIPPGFNYPDIPEDNTLTAERIALGKKLFFDPILSIDTSVSCGSCHFQEFAFTDQSAVSEGVEGRLGFRNAPTLANVAWHPYFLKDGGSPTLELQVRVPIEDHNEMGFNMAELVNRLQEHPEYPELMEEAYGRGTSAFAITRALAAFQRTLISGNSPFDEYEYQGNTGAMSEAAKRGMEIFFGEEAQCSSCHSGFNFTSYAFENNGLYLVYEDTGRARITGLSEDVGRFKVPTLRNVALTGPYMHDGSVQSLEAVIDHYADGGKGHENQSPLVKPLNLTAGEKADLLAFLSALTDTDFINNPDFKP